MAETRDLLVAHRRALLATPAHDLPALRRIRGDATEGDTRAWLAHEHQAGRVFAVTSARQTVVPAFQLTDTGVPLPDVAAINVILAQDAALTGWEQWGWWTSRTGLLSGHAPLDVIATDVARVETAARRFVRSDAF